MKNFWEKLEEDVDNWVILACVIGVILVCLMALRGWL